MKTIDKILQSKTLYAVIAVIASIFLWAYVANYENTTQEVLLTGLEVDYIGGEDILLDRDLLVTDQDMQSVTLTLLVKRSIATKLRNDSVHISVDLRDIRSTGVYEKVYLIEYDEVNEDDVIVTRKYPEYMTVNIDRLSTAPSVEIRGDFNGSTKEGFMKENIIYSPETIEVTGPETLVSRVAYAEVRIERENLDKTVTGKVPFVLKDQDGETIDSAELTTNVSEIEYTIPVTFTKEVGLTVKLIPGGGATADNVTVEINPATISLSGDQAELSTINQIQLGTIDLSTFAQSCTENFTILIPNGFHNESGDVTATVTVTVKGLATKRVVTTNISFINVSEGYIPTAITQYKEVVIRGPAEILDLIEGGNIRIIGDLTDIGSAVGRFSVPTTVVIDGYADAGVIGDAYNVVVSLEEAPPEEPGEETEGAP